MCAAGRLTGGAGHGPKYGIVGTGVVISCAIRTTPAVWVAGRADAEVVQPASIRVMVTVATTTSLRTVRIMTPPMVAGGSPNDASNDDLTLDCVSV